MPSCCKEDDSHQAAFGLVSPLSRYFPLPKNALLILSQRRGHLAAPTADTPWAKAWHSRTSLTFHLHPPWQCGEAAVGWRFPFQAGVAGAVTGGRSLQRVLQPQLPSSACTLSLLGNLRVGRNIWGTLAGWECVSKRFNGRASRPAGLFSWALHGSV